jgi:hypothetical protein
MTSTRVWRRSSGAHIAEYGAAGGGHRVGACVGLHVVIEFRSKICVARVTGEVSGGCEVGVGEAVVVESEGGGEGALSVGGDSVEALAGDFGDQSVGS